MSELERVRLEDQNGFKITLIAFNEESSIDDGLMEPDMVAELIERVNSNELMHFVACVSVSKAGVELGTDYLGACFHPDLEDFKKSGYLEQMTEAAMNEAKSKLIELNS